MRQGLKDPSESQVNLQMKNISSYVNRIEFPIGNKASKVELRWERTTPYLRCHTMALSSSEVDSSVKGPALTSDTWCTDCIISGLGKFDLLLPLV